MKQRIRAAGILIHQHSILLLKVKDFTGEYWVPPGGGLEEGDKSSKACLVREFKEEAGLEIDVGDLVCVREFLETEKNRYHCELFYHVTSHRGEPHLNNLVGLNDEHYIQKVEWVPLSELTEKRIYPKELAHKLLELIDNQEFSTHLGSYVQGEKEEVNYL